MTMRIEVLRGEGRHGHATAIRHLDLVTTVLLCVAGQLS